MGYDQENWNWATAQVQAIIEDNAFMYEKCAGLDPDGFKAEFLQYPRLAEVFTAMDMGRINWAELAEFFGYEPEPSNIVDFPHRGKTVEEVAQEAIIQGLSAQQAVERVLQAHWDAIELVIDTMIDQDARIERMQKQISTLIEVHGT